MTEQDKATIRDALQEARDGSPCFSRIDTAIARLEAPESERGGNTPQLEANRERQGGRTVIDIYDTRAELLKARGYLASDDDVERVAWCLRECDPLHMVTKPAESAPVPREDITSDAEAKVKALRGALEWYASKPERIIHKCIPVMAIIEDGSVARAALDGSGKA